MNMNLKDLGAALNLINGAIDYARKHNSQKFINRVRDCTSEENMEKLCLILKDSSHHLHDDVVVIAESSFKVTSDLHNNLLANIMKYAIINERMEYMHRTFMMFSQFAIKEDYVNIIDIDNAIKNRLIYYNENYGYKTLVDNPIEWDYTINKLINSGILDVNYSGGFCGVRGARKDFNKVNDFFDSLVDCIRGVRNNV